MDLVGAGRCRLQEPEALQPGEPRGRDADGHGEVLASEKHLGAHRPDRSVQWGPGRCFHAISPSGPDPGRPDRR